MATLEEEIGQLLKEKGLTLGTVESATGGLIAHRITNVPGSSEYYRGSVVSYNNELKMKVIGVKEATLQEYGSVSGPVAEQMAAGGRKILQVDICIADTGVAGPGGTTPGKAVGLFYLGLADQDGACSRRHEFSGSREENKKSAAGAALAWLKEYLTELP
ncbi:MAG: CinA family protein [Dehalococcoidales bacterium]|nr:CinA family protein [Dehalococcoidales bacterium]